MKTFDDLQNLWQQQAAALLPTAHQVQEQALATQRALRQKHLRHIVVLIGTAAALLAIDQVNRQRIAVSNLGLGILLACAIGFAAARWALLWNLDKLDWAGPVRDQLAQWATYRRHSQWLHRQGQVWYVGGLALGVAAYLWPIAKVAPWWMIAAAFLAFLVWGGFYTFFLQRRAADQEDQKLKDILTQLAQQEG